MKLSRLITWVVVLAVFAMAARVTMDNDSWWHLRAGQWMVENSSLMQEDLFSYTRAETPWKYPGLWVEAFMYLIYKWAGPGGLNVWTAGLVALTFFFVWKTFTTRGFFAAFVVVAAAVVSNIYWSARPYLITFLLTAVFLWFLEGYRWKDRKNLWALPVLMILWVNSHGAFLVGFLILACYFVDAFVSLLIALRQGGEVRVKSSKVKHLFIVGMLMVAALVINPQGIDLLSLPFTTVSRIAEQKHIEEWQSPNFHDIRMQSFAVFLVVAFGVMGASKRRMTVVEFLLVAGFGFMGLLAARFIALFAVVAPVVIIRHSEELLANWGELLNFRINIKLDRQPTPFLGWVNRVIVSLLILVVFLKVSIVLPAEENMAVFRESLPVTAAEFIKSEQPEGRMFNSYDFGGYLIWSLSEYPVFIDGRADLYGDEIIFEWLSIVRGEVGWQESLHEWGVGFVIVEPEMPLVERLEEEGWELIYADEVAVVFQR